jgi:TetR/AcrR family transcriptional repressor of nem operon
MIPAAREADPSTSSDKAAETRERIILEAARQFRRHGFAGIGVADLMHGVGLTHGGFYAHFRSKTELKALACRRAVADMLADWRAKADEAPDDPLGAIVRPYLSTEHRDDPGSGCLLAALGPEAAREDPEVRQTVADLLPEVLGTLAALMPAPDRAGRQRQAIVLFTGLVGAIVAARATTDPALSKEILSSVADALLPPG